MTNAKELSAIINIQEEFGKAGLLEFIAQFDARRLVEIFAASGCAEDLTAWFKPLYPDEFDKIYPRKIRVTPVNGEPFEASGTLELYNGVYYIGGASYPAEIVEVLEGENNGV